MTGPLGSRYDLRLMGPMEGAVSVWGSAKAHCCLAEGWVVRLCLGCGTILSGGKAGKGRKGLNSRDVFGHSVGTATGASLEVAFPY